MQLKLSHGSEVDFIKYVALLSSRDRIAVLSHTDFDGIASAVVITKFLEARKLKLKFLGFLNYKNDIFSDVVSKLRRRKINKVIIADINSEDSPSLKKIQEFANVLQIDHHPLAKNHKKQNLTLIKSDQGDCAAYLCYKLFNSIEDLSRWRQTVCSAMFADMAYTKDFNFIKETFPNVSLKNITRSNVASIARIVGSSLTYFTKNPYKVFKFVLKGRIGKLKKYYYIINKDVERCIKKFKQDAEYYPEKDLYFYYFKPKFRIGSYLSTVLSLKKPNKTFLLANSEKNNMIKISARRQDKKINLGLLMKKGIQGLENASGGGHAAASAALIKAQDLQKFKENILRD